MSLAEWESDALGSSEGGEDVFVRTSTWSGSPEQLEAWAKAVQEKVKPFVQQQSGNKGAFFLIDREGGKALTFTIWESEDAALATDQAADQSRSRTMGATGVTMVSKDRYEVVASIG
jgi:heme-degrading monooxygenase HmoA